MQHLDIVVAFVAFFCGVGIMSLIEGHLVSILHTYSPMRTATMWGFLFLLCGALVAFVADMVGCGTLVGVAVVAAVWSLDGWLRHKLHLYAYIAVVCVVLGVLGVTGMARGWRW